MSVTFLWGSKKCCQHTRKLSRSSIQTFSKVTDQQNGVFSFNFRMSHDVLNFSVVLSQSVTISFSQTAFKSRDKRVTLRKLLSGAGTGRQPVWADVFQRTRPTWSEFRQNYPPPTKIRTVFVKKLPHFLILCSNPPHPPTAPPKILPAPKCWNPPKWAGFRPVWSHWRWRSPR